MKTKKTPNLQGCGQNKNKDNAQPPRVRSNRVHQSPQSQQQRQQKQQQQQGSCTQQGSWTQQGPWTQQRQQHTQQQQRHRGRPTSKDEANEAGFSSGI